MQKNDELKKIGEVVRETVRPLKELIEILSSKVNKQELYVVTTASNVKSLKDQQSVINEKLDELKKQVSDPKTGLKRINEKMDALWDQTSELTVGADKRLRTVEAHAGIAAPPN